MKVYWLSGWPEALKSSPYCDIIDGMMSMSSDYEVKWQILDKLVLMPVFSHDWEIVTNNLMDERTDNEK
ncbi:MAG: hypothetical protein GY774_24325 [Planctomycetes bacterium]|nr:hypothetical protein [Planctomycetota bacterium]